MGDLVSRQLRVVQAAAALVRRLRAAAAHLLVRQMAEVARRLVLRAEIISILCLCVITMFQVLRR